MAFLGKKFIKAFFKGFGLELRKIPKGPLPWIYADPLEAIHHINQGQPSTMECDISLCVAFNGFAFGNLGWHPFVEAIREHLYSGHCSYAGSFLERYYATWQPKTAQDALIGAKSGPKMLSEYPAYLIYAPWNKTGINEHVHDLEKIAKHESILFTGEAISIKDGYCYQGPVSKKKGQMEYKRLISITSSIRFRGYDRTLGDVAVQILKRGNHYIYRVVHGHHRTAALAALGYSLVPCTPRMLVDIDLIDEWPQVRSGIWQRKEALEYFNHHFDFKPREWAISMGLSQTNAAIKRYKKSHG